MAETKRICTFLLRLIAFGMTLSAAIIMASSNERTTVLALSFEAKYSDTPAFKYFVIANAITSIYGFLLLFLPSKSLLWRLVVALDVVFTMLLTSSISAALAIAYVGKKGNSNAGWLPICGQVTKYCNQVKGALAVGFISVIIYMLLLLYSIHRVLNLFLVESLNYTEVQVWAFLFHLVLSFWYTKPAVHPQSEIRMFQNLDDT